jgi:hypothetical protein
MKFGKKPAKRLRKSLALSNYLNMSAVSYPPVHAWERPIDYGMLGNDKAGDCAYAGHFHMRMNWRAVADAGNPLIVTTEQVLADYAAGTGYDPVSGANDNGAVLTDVLKQYNDKYVTLDVQNVEQIKAAIFIFGAVYLGFGVPQSMVDQLGHGIDPTWEFLPNDKPSGEGHCVVVFGYGRAGVPPCSWGKIYHTPWEFWLQNVDEAYAVISPEWIKHSGVSPSGLDLTGLLADANALHNV